MVLMLLRKFFVLEVSSVHTNVVSPLTGSEYYEFFCLLSVMRAVVWSTRQLILLGLQVNLFPNAIVL